MSQEFRLKKSTCLKMELYIEGNGKMKTDMVTECKFGLMEQSMKVTGKKIKPMARVNFGMQMVMFLTEIGKTTKLMAMEFTLM